MKTTCLIFPAPVAVSARSASALLTNGTGREPNEHAVNASVAASQTLRFICEPTHYG
jgi:hypothetical protein